MSHRPEDRRTRGAAAWLVGLSRRSPLVVLALSLAATLVVAGHIWQTTEMRHRVRFESQARQAVDALDRRLGAYVNILIGGAALFAADRRDVSAAEFRRYVNALRVQDRYPGIQGIGYSVRLPIASRDSLVQAQRRVGFQDFHTWPESGDAEFHAIVYLLPQDVRNRVAMGYDMWSTPVRREAMARARDSGRPAASGRVTLVQEIDENVQPGFLIYVPVYQGVELPATVAERRARLRGFVYAPFRSGDLLHGLLGTDAPVELQVYDGPRAEPEALLWDSREKGAGTASQGSSARLNSVAAMQIAGRPWTVSIRSGLTFEAPSDRWMAPLVLALGLPISGALFLLTSAESRAHRRAEETREALEASEAQYRIAFDANPNPMWVYDADTLRFLAVNEAAVEHYGYSRAEFERMTARDIRPPEDVPRLERYLAGEHRDDSRPSTWRHLKRDGSLILVEVSSNTLSRFAGRPSRLVLAHDVTERTRTQLELAEVQADLQQILRLSTAIIYTMDIGAEHDTYSWITENVTRVTGYPASESLEPGWWQERIHPEDRETVLATAAQLLEQGHRTVEYRFRHADGHYMWIRDDAVLRWDDAGDPAEVIGSWLDVTERKQLELQFHTAQKMEAVGRLAGGIAHDFNNILTVIRSQSDLLLLDLPPGPHTSELELIQQAADRASALTYQLLAFSRGQFLVPQVIDAATCVQNVTRLLARVLGEKVTVCHDLPGDLPAIEVDPGQLEQALMNLALNARDAMPEGGTLTFTARTAQLESLEGYGPDDFTPGRYTVLQISDTGIGMDADVRGRVFEPFFTTKASGEGTGLGLPMVYGFVRQSNGTIHVASEPGQGATFTLYFPASTRRPAPVTEGEAAKAPRAQYGRILLIEDEANVRRAARRILERAGMTVVDVESAEAGLDALAAPGGYDLAVTDLGLPGMSGREFVERARSQLPDMPLIIISGYEASSTGPHAQLPPRTTFVRKPFTIDGLLGAVQQALHA